MSWTLNISSVAGGLGQGWAREGGSGARPCRQAALTVGLYFENIKGATGRI